MSDLRKAAEMALDGFEKIHKGFGAIKEESKFRGDEDIKDLATEVRKNCNKHIKALRQALAQPEQEPVAWVDAKPDGYDFHGLREVPFGKHHLYTAPLIQQEMLKQAYLDGVNSGIKAMQTRSEK